MLAKLNMSGWYVSATGISNIDVLVQQVIIVAQQFGEIVPGRGRRSVERVVPRTPEAAHAGSLSAKYGLNSLPLHTDLAHWSTPCRYIVMACADVGSRPAPTVLLDSRLTVLSDREAVACTDAVFFVRNGRHSFYGSILDRGREFIRVDPGCMSPLSSEGEIAFQAFGADRNGAALYRHNWNPGEILIIDNWRVLHGRGAGAIADGRTLLRASVK